MTKAESEHSLGAEALGAYPITNVRVLPLLMENPDIIYKNVIQDQFKNKYYGEEPAKGISLDGSSSQEAVIDLADIPLSKTLLLLTAPSAPVPDAVMLIGGSVDIHRDIPAGHEPSPEVQLRIGALKHLEKDAHAYGITDKSLRTVQHRKPYLIHGLKKQLISETIYAAPLIPGFSPMAIGTTKKHHAEFYAANVDQLRSVLEEEKLILEDGREFRLPGNLRREPKERFKDQHMVAHSEDISATKEKILGALERYEVETRRDVAQALALRMEQVLKTYQGDWAQWRKTWIDLIIKHPGTTNVSRDRFNEIYRNFLFQCQFQIRKNLPLRYPYHQLAFELYQALNSVYQSHLTAYARNLPVQGSLLLASRPRRLNQLSQQNFMEMVGKKRAEQLHIAHSKDFRHLPKEIFDGGPEHFAKFVRFVFEAFGVNNSKDLFHQLHVFRGLIVARVHENDPSIRAQREKERQEQYQKIVMRMYQTFMTYVLPQREYEMVMNGIADPQDRYQKWREIYANHSAHHDSFHDMLTQDTTLSIASHPAVPLNLGQEHMVTSDQLPEHLLGCFDINPYSNGPKYLDEATGFEFRRKMVGIIMDISETTPHFDEQTAQNTYFFRDVLQKLAGKEERDGINEYNCFLITDSEGKNARLVPTSTPPDQIKGQILDRVVKIKVELLGRTVDIFYTYGDKKYVQLHRKVYERDLLSEKILDVTRFSIGIDSSSLGTEFSNLEEKNIFCKQLVYELEKRIEETAQDPLQGNYHYKELTKHDNRRKDNLEGKSPMGGSGASRRFRFLKKYIQLQRGIETQVQEVQFYPDIEAAAEKKFDDIRAYANRRLQESKLVEVRDDHDIVLYRYMAYPLLNSHFPPEFTRFRGGYVDLMTGRRPYTRLQRTALRFQSALGRFARAGQMETSF